MPNDHCRRPSFEDQMSQIEDHLRFFRRNGPVEFDEVIEQTEQALQNANVIREGGDEGATYLLRWQLRALAALKLTVTKPRDLREVAEIIGVTDRHLHNQVANGSLKVEETVPVRSISMLNLQQQRCDQGPADQSGPDIPTAARRRKSKARSRAKRSKPTRRCRMAGRTRY